MFAAYSSFSGLLVRKDTLRISETAIVGNRLLELQKMVYIRQLEESSCAYDIFVPQLSNDMDKEKKFWFLKLSYRIWISQSLQCLSLPRFSVSRRSRRVTRSALLESGGLSAANAGLVACLICIMERLMSKDKKICLCFPLSSLTTNDQANCTLHFAGPAFKVALAVEFKHWDAIRISVWRKS